MNISTIIPLMTHNAILALAIGCVTLLAWHGTVSGNDAIVVILAAAGINGTGTAGFVAGQRVTPVSTVAPPAAPVPPGT